MFFFSKKDYRSNNFLNVILDTTSIRIRHFLVNVKQSVAAFYQETTFVIEVLEIHADQSRYLRYTYSNSLALPLNYHKVWFSSMDIFRYVTSFTQVGVESLIYPSSTFYSLEPLLTSH